MPTIKPYQQQVSPEGSLGGRQASGSDFGGVGLQQLGQAAMGAGVNLARAEAIAEHARGQKEATDAAVWLSQTQTILATGLDEDAKSWKPGMDSVQQVTVGKATSMFDRGLEQFTTEPGRATYRTHAASIMAQFSQISGTMQSKLDGQAAVEQRETYVDTKSAFLQIHPAYAQLEIDTAAAVMGDPKGLYARVGAVLQQKGVRETQERLAVSAVQGLIRQTPLLAEETLNNPELAEDKTYGWISKHIPQEKMGPLLEHARGMADLEVRKLGQAEAAEAKAKDIEWKATLGQATVQWLTAQSGPHYNPAQTKREVITFFQENPTAVVAHPEMVRATLSAIDADIAEQKSGKKAGNTDLEDRLTTGIINGTITDLTPVLRARAQADNPISTEQMRRIEAVFRDQTSPEGRSLNEARQSAFKAVEQFIAPRDKFGSFTDTSMVFQVERAKQYAVGREAQYRKEHKSVFPLYDISSPEYLFTPERVAPFMRSMTDRMDTALKLMFPNAGEGTNPSAAPAPGTPTAPKKDTRPSLGGILFKHLAPKGQP